MMASRYDDLNYVLNLAIVQDPPPGSYGTPEPRPQQVGLTWHVYYNNISMNCFLFVWSCCIYVHISTDFRHHWVMGQSGGIREIRGGTSWDRPCHSSPGQPSFPWLNTFQCSWQTHPTKPTLSMTCENPYVFKKPEGIQILLLTKMNWIKAVQVYSIPSYLELRKEWSF